MTTRSLLLSAELITEADRQILNVLSVGGKASLSQVVVVFSMGSLSEWCIGLECSRDSQWGYG